MSSFGFNTIVSTESNNPKAKVRFTKASVKCAIIKANVKCKTVKTELKIRMECGTNN